METNIVVDISPTAPYLAKFWFWSYGRKCCQPVKLQDSLKCNISRKKWIMKFIFGMQINTEVVYKLILSFWVCATRHAKVPKIRSLHIFAISPEKRGWGSEVDFLPANKHKNFQQVDSIALGLRSQACPKYPKQVYNISVIS